MSQFAWSDTFSVKVTKIDDHHKKLVQLVNDLQEASTKGQGKDVVGKVLSELIDYTTMHFGTEEALMKQHDYPDYPGHKKLHDDLVKQVLALQEKFKSGGSFVTVEVMNFLQNWLIQHICNIDKKLGAFLNTKNIK